MAYIVYMQRQLKQQMDDLTSELAIKEKSVIKLKDDDNKILLSEKKVELLEKVQTYMYQYSKAHPDNQKVPMGIATYFHHKIILVHKS